VEKSPFIHKFKTENGRYVYDVNSNRILKVDGIEFDLIDDYQRLPKDDLHSKWGGVYDGEKIDQTLAGFNEWSTKGYLSTGRPQSFLPLDNEDLKDQLTSKMQQILLNVTEVCNLRCRYCIYSGACHYERRHSRKTMTADTARKAIRHFWEHSRGLEKVHVSFYGGEPLVAFDLLRDTIAFARKLGEWPTTYLHVDTNGTLLTDAKIRYFIDNKFYLQVSLDGPKEIHDRFRVFRNGKGTFDRVMHNLEKIRRMDPEYYGLYVSFAATLVPPYDLERLNDFFSSPPFQNNQVNVTPLGQYDTEFFDRYARGIESKLEATYRSLRERYVAKRAANDTPTNFERTIFEQDMTKFCSRGFSAMNGSVHPNGICLPGARRVFVTVDGKYYPCERVVGDEFRLGDVEKGIEAEQVKRLVENYMGLSTPDCFNCWAVRLCRMCFSMARKGGRLDRERKSLQCDATRGNMDQVMVTYMRIMEQNAKGFDFVKDMVFE